MVIHVCFLLLCLTAFAADPSLVVYLPMDDGKGDKVTDVSGNGHDGTIVGNAEWIDGKYGRAVNLIAAGAGIQIPDDKALDGMKAMTVEVWVRQDNHQATGIIQKGTNWPNISYLLQPWSDQNIYFGVKDTSSRAITKPGDYPLFQFHTGSIKSHGRLRSRVIIPCFNSILVRLKVAIQPDTRFQRARLFRASVSILN